MGPEPIRSTRIDNLQDYAAFYRSMVDQYRARRDVELGLINGESFEFAGRCYVCDRDTRFLTDLLYADGRVVEGKAVPNWRERVICPGCGLNNRMRACIHFLEQNLDAAPRHDIYIAEQSTPLYRHLAGKYPGLVGSEYFGERVPFGDADPATGWRNESVTGLTFGDGSLDYILSFDVYEHVPAYLDAFRECHRTLRDGGVLLFTVPYDKGSHDNLVRARLREDGAIEHLAEPQYHGDPVNSEGCLSFYTFGWEMLDRLKELGFREAAAHFFWSLHYGYLGEQEEMLFAARK